MSASYVRSHYPVDYKRGDRLVLRDHYTLPRHGVLVSFPDQYLGIRFDGEKRTSRCHPTWCIEREAHEFREDVEDYSMCVCGMPALGHAETQSGLLPR